MTHKQIKKREKGDYEDISDVTDSLGNLVEEDNDYRNSLYEDTLASCGFRNFQTLLILVSGWALASDSVEIQVVSFVLPTACDLEMTSNEKGWLNAIVFVGMMIGGYILGGAADVKGRRYILLWSLIINGGAGLASAFSPNFACFISLRFLCSIGVGAAIPVVFTYCAEFLNTIRRGPIIGILVTFWLVSNILTSVLARLILPHVDLGGPLNKTIFFGSWRIFVVVGAIPSLTSVLFIFLMPESPMYLTNSGRYEEAYDAFIRVFRRNFGRKAPIPQEIEQFRQYYTTYVNKNMEDHKNEGICSHVVGIMKTLTKVLKSTYELFKKPHCRTTILLIIIWFTLSFGYYGLWMWFPEIFERVESGSGSTCSRASLITQNVTSNLTCLQMTAQQTSVYMESLLVALANIPGNLLTVLTVNKLGRRPLMSASMVISALSVFFFGLVKDRTGMTAMSCIFSGMSIAGWNVLDMLSVEHYPTHLRSTAFGVQSGFGRIAAISGNVAFGELIDEHCAIPLLLVFVFLCIGGLTVLKLPKTDDSSLT